MVCAKKKNQRKKQEESDLRQTDEEMMEYPDFNPQESHEPPFNFWKELQTFIHSLGIIPQFSDQTRLVTENEAKMIMAQFYNINPNLIPTNHVGVRAISGMNANNLKTFLKEVPNKIGKQILDFNIENNNNNYNNNDKIEREEEYELNEMRSDDGYMKGGRKPNININMQAETLSSKSKSNKSKAILTPSPVKDKSPIKIKQQQQQQQQQHQQQQQPNMVRDETSNLMENDATKVQFF